MIEQVAAPPASSTVVPVLVAIIGALGIVIAALVARMAQRKSKPENASIIVDAAEALVGISQKEIERLDRERTRLEVRIDEIEHDFEKRLLAVTTERDQMAERLAIEVAKNAELESRVAALESELAVLKNGH